VFEHAPNGSASSEMMIYPLYTSNPDARECAKYSRSGLRYGPAGDIGINSF